MVAGVLVLALPASAAWAAAGDVLWSLSLAGPGPTTSSGTTFYATAVGPDGTVYSVGAAPPRGGGNAMVTMARSPAGTLVWAAWIQGSPGGLAAGRALAVDTVTGRLYVTGHIDTPTDGLDYLTVAYDLDHGTELWRAQYDEAGGEDSAREIAVDPNRGTVYVSGTGTDAQGASVRVTVAYSSVGTRLWRNQYRGDDNRYDYATGLALDSQGTAARPAQGARITPR